jgi:hypothetical protein
LIAQQHGHVSAIAINACSTQIFLEAPSCQKLLPDLQTGLALGLMYLRYTSKVNKELIATISEAPLEVTAMKQMMTTSTAPAGPIST